MIPHTDDALRMLSQRIMTQLLPDLSSMYSLSDGALVGLLMNAVADELEEGIDRRLNDIKEMQEIFSSARGGLSPDEILIVDAEPDSMKLSAVDERHDALTRVLIALHSRSEQNVAMTDVNHNIWRYLRRHTERHAITAIP